MDEAVLREFDQTRKEYVLRCDNQTVMHISNNPSFHSNS